jgi:hypothetical protein
MTSVTGDIFSSSPFRVICVGLTGPRRLPVYPGERIFSGKAGSLKGAKSGLVRRSKLARAYSIMSSLVARWDQGLAGLRTSTFSPTSMTIRSSPSSNGPE